MVSPLQTPRDGKKARRQGGTEIGAEIGAEINIEIGAKIGTEIDVDFGAKIDGDLGIPYDVAYPFGALERRGARRDGGEREDMSRQSSQQSEAN